jgi:hypothetical protein
MNSTLGSITPGKGARNGRTSYRRADPVSQFSRKHFKNGGELFQIFSKLRSSETFAKEFLFSSLLFFSLLSFFLTFIFLPSKRRRIEVRKGKREGSERILREEKFCDDHRFGDRDGTRLRPVEFNAFPSLL